MPAGRLVSAGMPATAAAATGPLAAPVCTPVPTDSLPRHCCCCCCWCRCRGCDCCRWVWVMTVTRCCTALPWLTWRAASRCSSRCCPTWCPRASTCGWAVRQKVRTSKHTGPISSSTLTYPVSAAVSIRSQQRKGWGGGCPWQRRLEEPSTLPRPAPHLAPPRPCTPLCLLRHLTSLCRTPLLPLHRFVQRPAP